MGTLDGKVAVVTGAGQGVGQGIALALAREGAEIAVLGRTESKLHDTCARIEQISARGVAVVCDVSEAGQISQGIARTLEAFGGIDILVNNANDGGPGSLLDTSDEEFQKRFSIGPLATFRFMRACHPHLVARGGGSIVNLVTSASRRWDASNYGVYAAVKEAMRALTRAAACEWGKEGIRVNAVAPLARSPGLEWWISERPEEAAAFFKTIPLGRIGDCEQDIGRVVAFLVGPDAGYLTGATIPLDGGQAYWG